MLTSDIPQILRPFQFKHRAYVLSPTPGLSRINNMGCGARYLEDGRWQLWFDQTEKEGPNIGYALYDPRDQRVIRYPASLDVTADSTSELVLHNLPKGWRPRQPKHLILQDGQHRLYFWVDAPGVVRYLSAYSDDGRHYHVHDPHSACLYHPHDRAAQQSAPSGLTRHGNQSSPRPDGEPPASPWLICNDATNVYQLPDGRFELYTADIVAMQPDDPGWIAYDNAPGYRRVIIRMTSADGLTWANRQTVLNPDEHDPADLQFYYLSVTHTTQGRVGILGHYRCKHQTMDMELCHSEDGMHWHRPARCPLFERGQPGEPDSYAMLAGHAMVRANDQWHLLYTGYNFSHNHQVSDGPEASHILHLSTD